MSKEHLKNTILKIKEIHYSDEIQNLLKEYFKTSQFPFVIVNIRVNNNNIRLNIHQDKFCIRLCYIYDLYDFENIDKPYVVDSLVQKIANNGIAIDLVYDFMVNELKSKIH